MSDQKIRAELNALPIAELIARQRQEGRSKLQHGFKDYWKQKHDYAVDLLADERRGRLVRRLAELLREITYPIHALSIDPFLTYYAYTDVGVIDWFIGPTHAPFRDLKGRALDGIFALLRDLAVFEADSITGFETRHRENLDVSVLQTRLHRIEEAVTACKRLFGLIVGESPDHPLELVHYDTLEQYVTEPSRVSALIHFSCFPQTEYHDGVVFLRTIHVSELCFFGLRMTFMEAIENLRQGRLDVVARCLGEATAFGEVLHRGFRVLRTMPPEHFVDFRDFTGKASAIQSRGYQFRSYAVGSPVRM